MDGRKEPLSIAIIGSRGYPSTYGGFETFVRHLAPGLRDAGGKVTVYNRHEKIARVQTAVVDGIEIVTVPGFRGQSLSTLTHGLAAVLHARRKRYDALIVLNVAHGHFLRLVRKTPTIVCVDGLEWRRGKWGRLAKTYFRTAARAAAMSKAVLVADSVEIQAVWRSEFGAEPEYISYGSDIDLRPLEDVVRSEGLTPGGYWLVVARLVPENGIEEILKAAESCGFPIPLVVVGTSGRSQDPLDSLVERYTETGRVKWMGHVSDQVMLQALWRHCRVYIHGHSVGGVNPALLQAVGFGAKTLARNTPYNREVLGDARELLWDDGHDLSEKLKCSLEAEPGPDHSVIRRLEERFQWDQVIETYASLLWSVSGASDCRRTIR